MRTKGRQPFSEYTRSCRKCGGFYKTPHKYSSLCQTCRSNKSIMKDCPECGGRMQFGDSQEKCPNCRHRAKVRQIVKEKYNL